MLGIVHLAVLCLEKRRVAVVGFLLGLEGLVVEPRVDMTFAESVARGTTPLKVERALGLAWTDEATLLLRDVSEAGCIAALIVNVRIRA